MILQELAAANDCDKEIREKKLTSRTVYKYFQWLKAQDTSVIRRRKRKSNHVTPEQARRPQREEDESSSENELSLSQFFNRRNDLTSPAAAGRSTATNQTLAGLHQHHLHQRHNAMYPPRQLPQTTAGTVPRQFFNLENVPRRASGGNIGGRRNQSHARRGRGRGVQIVDTSVQYEGSDDEGETFNRHTSGGRFRMR